MTLHSLPVMGKCFTLVKLSMGESCEVILQKTKQCLGMLDNFP